MKISYQDVLNRFRGRGWCEWCEKWAENRDAHHAFKCTGAGGGSRIDDDCNVCGLHRECHTEIQENPIKNDKMKHRIARREGATVQEIEDWLNLVLRTPKEKPVPAKPWEQP